MITIFVYGLDQFVTGRLSRELSANLADLYEIDEDEICFIASDEMVFHKGVEQTSWNVFVKVNAPEIYKILEDNIASYLLDQLSYYSINVEIEFVYHDERRIHSKMNDEYPRYITDENMVNIDTERVDDDEDDEDYKTDDEGVDIFEGDIFKNFNGD